MMNIMMAEEIKHEAAKEVFSGTEYNWTDMLDSTADEQRRISRLSEEKQFDEWVAYFSNMLMAYRESDAQTGEAK